MDPAITSTASAAPQEYIVHCAFGKTYPSKGCASPFGLRWIQRVDPAKGTQHVSFSDLLPDQRIAISQFADSLTALEKTGLIVGCCCQTKRAREAQMTPAPADVGGWVVINAGSEPVQDNPWTEFSDQFGFLARSEPPPAVAEAPCASGSSADTTEQNAQILSDFEYACQLQTEHDTEVVTGNIITPEAPPTNSQMQIDNPPAGLAPPRPLDPRDIYHPGFWSTKYFYDC